MHHRELSWQPARQRTAAAQPGRPRCSHLGEIVAREPCACGSERRVEVFHCPIRGLCCPAGDAELIRGFEGARLPQNCGSCPDHSAREKLVRVTIGIPVRGEIELLRQVLELHRRQQGVRPRFMLVDTGTPAEEKLQLAELGTAPDVELFWIPRREWAHSSEPVSAAMDLIWSIADTEFLLATHADCLPARPDAVLDVLRLCTAAVPVIGYQMSPRKPHPIWLWERMLSHTFTMFHLPTLRPTRLTWSLLGAAAATDTLSELRAPIQGWPDTECGFNWSLWQSGLTPESGRVQILGPEQNYEFDKTAHYWHVRSIASARLYSPDYYTKALRWRQEAIAQAQRWCHEWSQEQPC